jgi:hypothetical protein
MVKAKMKDIAKIKERYVAGTSAAAETWQANFLASNVVERLKSPDAVNNLKAKLNEMVQAYGARVAKLTDEDVKGPVRRLGSTVYSTGTSNAADKMAKGIDEVVGAAVKEVDLPDKSPVPLSPANRQRWEKIVTAIHQKSQQRKGIKPA